MKVQYLLVDTGTILKNELWHIQNVSELQLDDNISCILCHATKFGLIWSNVHISIQVQL